MTAAIPALITPTTSTARDSSESISLTKRIASAALSRLQSIEFIPLFIGKPLEVIRGAIYISSVPFFLAKAAFSLVTWSIFGLVGQNRIIEPFVEASISSFAASIIQSIGMIRHFFLKKGITSDQFLESNIQILQAFFSSFTPELLWNASMYLWTNYKGVEAIFKIIILRQTTSSLARSLS